MSPSAYNRQCSSYAGCLLLVNSVFVGPQKSVLQCIFLCTVKVLRLLCRQTVRRVDALRYSVSLFVVNATFVVSSRRAFVLILMTGLQPDLWRGSKR